VASLGDVTNEIRMDLATLFLPIYCGLYVLGLVIVSKYRITRADHDEHLQQLSARKEKLAE
jgi:Na+/melibiose symporter-like transporter